MERDQIDRVKLNPNTIPISNDLSGLLKRVTLQLNKTTVKAKEDMEPWKRGKLNKTLYLNNATHPCTKLTETKEITQTCKHLIICNTQNQNCDMEHYEKKLMEILSKVYKFKPKLEVIAGIIKTNNEQWLANRWEVDINMSRWKLIKAVWYLISQPLLFECRDNHPEIEVEQTKDKFDTKVPTDWIYHWNIVLHESKKLKLNYLQTGQSKQWWKTAPWDLVEKIYDENLHKIDYNKLNKDSIKTNIKIHLLKCRVIKNYDIKSKFKDLHEHNEIINI